MSCSFVSNESICGPFKEESTIIPLSSCTSDIRDHLRSTLGVSVKRSAEDESVLSEIDLILNRSGQFRADHSKTTEGNLRLTGLEESVTHVPTRHTKGHANSSKLFEE